MRVIFQGVETICIIWGGGELTGTLHFWGFAEKIKKQNYFLEIDFHSFFAYFLRTKLI